MIRVALLDPHPVVHKGFKSFFRKTEHIQVVGTFSQANDLFHFLETNKIDALILEMELEGDSAVQVIKWVKSKLPETAIIIYTSLPQSIYGVSLLKAGAAGYLSKQVSRKVMLEAIEKVVGNGYHITSNFAHKISNNVDLSKPRNAYETLSPRENPVDLFQQARNFDLI